jgi:hypothetical protein
MIDYSTAQAPIPRQMVPTMGEWQRLRHQQDGRPGFAVRLSSFGSNRLRRFAAYALQWRSAGGGHD